jgi:hypothetical protein
MSGEFELAIEILGQLLSLPGFLSTNILLKDPKWFSLTKLSAFTELLEKYK